jgi:hypothetical protein
VFERVSAGSRAEGGTTQNAAAWQKPNKGSGGDERPARQRKGGMGVGGEGSAGHRREVWVLYVASAAA